MSQTVWPLNENGEIVFTAGTGSGNVTGYLSQDVLPSKPDGSIPVKLVGVDVSSQIEDHNEDLSSHPDIRATLVGQVLSAQNSANTALAAQVASEAARDAAILSVPLKDTIAQGLSAVADGQVFAVKKGGTDGLGREARFRRDSSSTYTKLGEIFTGEEFDANISDMPQSETGLIFAITDEAGSRTWLEAGLDGGPTGLSLDKIGAGLNSENTPAIATAGQQDISDENELAFAVVDSADRRTDIEIGQDGRFTQRVIDSLSERLLGGLRGVSGPDISCIGDSMTAGAGAISASYPTVLASLTGRTVWNFGVGGETSATIAGRAGCRPWLASIAGGVIPASGGVTITMKADDGSTVAPLLQGSAGLNPVSIAGVTGNISYSGGVYTFTRATDGAAVPVNFPEPVFTAIAASHLGDIIVMWWGQNDGTNDATAIIGRQRALIEGMRAIDKRWLVVGLTTVNAEYRAPMEAQFIREFGRRFVNLREYLSSAAAMQDAGLTPTSTDLSQMALGQVPDSLRSDATHLNDAGYARAAHFIYKRLMELEFI